jgi:hypothetical protein
LRKASRLLSVTENGERLFSERLHDEVAHRASIVEMMLGPKVLKMRATSISNPCCP